MAYGNVMMDAQRDYRSCWNVMSHGYLQQFICLSKQRLVQERRAAAAKKRAHSDLRRRGAIAALKPQAIKL
jgi:hypothetical protein